MEPSASKAAEVASFINRNVKCPCCHCGIFKMLPFDLCPTQDILTCAACGAELYITVLKGK
jgi:hypothetical protein